MDPSTKSSDIIKSFNLIKKAIEDFSTNISLAINFDKNQDFRNALLYYKIALKNLKFLSSTPRYKEESKYRINEIINRIEELENLIENNEKINKESKENKNFYQIQNKNKNKQNDNKREKEESKQMVKEEKEIEKKEIKVSSDVKDMVLLTKSKVKWTDIVNLDKPKKILKEAIVIPLLRPELFKGIRKPWTEILLYGPPGCGKTLLAKAVANECDALFFVIDSGSLLSKYYGESEKRLKTLFEEAERHAPSLIFIDEIDALFSKRGGANESPSDRRIKTQLLTLIDGVKEKSNKILILAATNYPWDLDNALLSRFQQKIYVDLPDKKGRECIIKMNLKDIDYEKNIDFNKLAEMTEGYSGRDLVNLCREAVMEPIRELNFDYIADPTIKDIKVRSINFNDFIKALKEIKPSINKEILKKYSE
ncbi:MAG: ATP-binding protein [Promethearchaeota archaeon]